MKRRIETDKRLEYIKNKGYKVYIIWECEFEKLKKSEPLIQKIQDKYLPYFYTKNKRELTENEILNSVLSGELFGMVEVDISPPEKWTGNFKSNLTPTEYFEEFPPIFVTTQIPYEAFGEHMQEHCEKFNLSKDPRKLLVSSMSEEKILLATPLLQWYLQHGLKVTKIYQVIEYGKSKCFKNFIERMTQSRRIGDSSPDKALFGESMKLHANSSYGSLLINKEKYTQTIYVKGERDAKIEINKPQFRDVEYLGDEIFELSMGHKVINLNMPIQCGFFVLQLAKLRLNQFYYDCLDKFIERKNFGLLQCDTDSLYFGISEENFSDVIKPELLEEYHNSIQNKCNVKNFTANEKNYFPRTCCKNHMLYDKREPGLFKTEAQGIEMICLCSKTYCLKQKEGFKISCKGISKKYLKDPFKIFNQVLHNQKALSGHISGFLPKNLTMMTYSMDRQAFSYFYVKKEVESNGISTKPLNIIQNPWSELNSIVISDQIQDILSISFEKKLSIIMKNIFLLNI